MSASDKWTFFHFLGGLVVGTTVAYAPIKHKYELAIATVVGFEIIEQSIFASWMKIIPEEPLLNTVLDIVVGGLGASIPIYLSRGV